MRVALVVEPDQEVLGAVAHEITELGYLTFPAEASAQAEDLLRFLPQLDLLVVSRSVPADSIGHLLALSEALSADRRVVIMSDGATGQANGSDVLTLYRHAGRLELRRMLGGVAEV